MPNYLNASIVRSKTSGFVFWPSGSTAYNPTSSNSATAAVLQIKVSSSLPANIISDSEINPFIKFTTVSGSNVSNGYDNKVVIRFFTSSHVLEKYKDKGISAIGYMPLASQSLYHSGSIENENLTFLDIDYVRGTTGGILGNQIHETILSSSLHQTGLISASFESSSNLHTTTITYTQRRGEIGTSPEVFTGSKAILLGESISTLYTDTGSGALNFVPQLLLNEASSSLVFDVDRNDQSSIEFRVGISESKFVSSGRKNPTLMYFSSSGTVGIKTKNPRSDFEVSGSVKGDEIITKPTTGRPIKIKDSEIKFYETTEQDPQHPDYDDNKERARIKAVPGSFNLVFEVSGSEGYTKSVFISQSGRIGFNTDKPQSEFDARVNEAQFQRPGTRKGLKINQDGNIESFNKDLASAATGSEFVLRYSRGSTVNEAMMEAVTGQSFANDEAAETFFNNLKPSDQNEILQRAEELGFNALPSVGDTIGSIRFIAESGSTAAGSGFDDRITGEAASITAKVHSVDETGVRGDLIFKVADQTGAAVQRMVLDSGDNHQLSGSLDVGGTNSTSAGIKLRGTGGNLQAGFFRVGSSAADLKIGRMLLHDDGTQKVQLSAKGKSFIAGTSGTGTTGTFLGINTQEPTVALQVEGDISASGGITSSNLVIETNGSNAVLSVTRKSNAELKLKAQDTKTRITYEGGPLLFDRDGSGTNTLTLGIGGHITSSGNISASGTIFADTAQFGSSTVIINGPAGHITASGNISASGKLLSTGLEFGTFTNFLNFHAGGTANTFKYNEWKQSASGGTTINNTAGTINFDSKGNADTMVISGSSVGIGTPNPQVLLALSQSDNSTFQTYINLGKSTYAAGSGPAIFFKTSPVAATDRYGVKLGAQRQSAGTADFVIEQELDNGSGGAGGRSETFRINSFGNISASGDFTARSGSLRNLLVGTNIPAASGSLPTSPLTVQANASSGVIDLEVAKFVRDINTDIKDNNAGYLRFGLLDSSGVGAFEEYESARIQWEAKSNTEEDTSLLSFWTSHDDTLSQQMTIDNLGNVGIGTTTPGEKLEVIGNISASGNIEATSFTGSFSGTVTGDATGLTGTPDITVGAIEATSLNVTSITSSIITSSILQTEGSNIFGDTDSDTHTFNGSITASSDISASGQVKAQSFEFDYQQSVIGVNSIGNDIVFLRVDDGQFGIVNGVSNIARGLQTDNTNGWQIGNTNAGISGRQATGVSTVAINAGGNQVLTVTGSKAGIGTTTPPEALTVEGNISSSGGIQVSFGTFSGTTDTKTDAAIVIPENKAIYTLDSSGAHLRNLIRMDSDIIKIGQGPTVLIDEIRLQPGSFGFTSFYSASAEVARVDIKGNITSSGNISSSGTGTNFLGGNLTFNGDRTINTVGAGDSLTINPAAQLFLGSSDTDVIEIGRQSGTSTAGRTEIYAHTATPAALFQNSTITFNHPITASGNISASGELSVTDNAFIGGRLSVNTTSTSARVNVVGTQAHQLSGGSNTFKITGVSNADALFVSSSGKVGIGTTDPQKKLDIAGGDIRLDNSQGIFFATTDGNIGRVGITGDESSDFIQLKVDNSNNHLLRLNTTGVGIGTSTPSEKLTVTGNISASGHLNIAGITSSGDVHVDQYIYHDGDLTNYHRFLSNRQIFVVGNDSSIDLNNGVSTFGVASKATTVQGDELNLTGPVTASGDISASGNLYLGEGANYIGGKRFITSTDGFEFRDGTLKALGGIIGKHITASGNISASGLITTNTLNIVSTADGGATIGNDQILHEGITATANNLTAGTATGLSGTPNILVANVTSSNISASGNLTANGITIETGGPVLTLKDTTDDDDHRILFRDESNNIVHEIKTSDDTGGLGGDMFLIKSVESKPLGLGTNDTLRLTIEAAGNVGIGTTSPGEKLEVVGNISASGDVEALTFTSPTLDVTAGSAQITEDKPLTFGNLLSGDTGKLNIKHDGSDGTITNNTGDLTINNSSGDTIIANQGSSGKIILAPNETPGPNTNSGQVLISGTSDGLPPHLKVEGEITASGNISSSGTIIGSNLSGTNTGDQNISNLAITGSNVIFSNITSSTLRLTSTTDASATSTDHAFQAGLTNGANVIIDNNEVMARNNGSTADLHLNPDGGAVSFNNSVSTKVRVENGHITASGNISSSGTVQGLTGSFSALVGDTSQGTSLEVDGPITGSAFRGTKHILRNETIYINDNPFVQNSLYFGNTLGNQPNNWNDPQATGGTISSVSSFTIAEDDMNWGHILPFDISAVEIQCSLRPALGNGDDFTLVLYTANRSNASNTAITLTKVAVAQTTFVAAQYKTNDLTYTADLDKGTMIFVGVGSEDATDAKNARGLLNITVTAR